MKGIDLSTFQGTEIDFAKVKASGVEICMIKATEGLTWTSDCFKAQHAGAIAAGLSTGFYHYLRANSSVDEAKHLLSVTEGLAVQCKYVIDVEVMLGQSIEKLSLNVRQFADYLISQGKEVAVYSGDSFYECNLNSTVKDLSCWIAHYGVTSPDTDPYAGFQYSESGIVSGYDGEIDVNIFNNGMLIGGSTPNEIIPEVYKYGTVTAKDGLDVREEPSLTGLRIGLLKNGTKVRLSNKYSDFWGIYFGDFGGYCSAEYIDDGTTPVVTPTKVIIPVVKKVVVTPVIPVVPTKVITKVVVEPIPVKTSGIVNCEILHVRKEASLTASILGTLKKGTEVKITEEKSGFYNIEFGVHGAFVSCEYIK
jgi:uncharacterized protein YgiM (DUF1202 family)